VALEPVPAYAPFRCGDLGFAYNEAAFRHFLGLERQRAHRSGRSLLLILVQTRGSADSRRTFDTRGASQVFHALGSGVREVDVVGWFRDDRVAGAIVPLNADATADASSRVASRIERMLKVEMGQEQLARIRVRVVRLGGKVSH
jgi:hypothetical protein